MKIKCIVRYKKAGSEWFESAPMSEGEAQATILMMTAMGCQTERKLLVQVDQQSNPELN